MNSLELVEYAVYHWTLGGSHGLPGIDEKGFFDQEFFKEYAKKKNTYQDFVERFKEIKKDSCLNDNNSLMLCSGGVDSSLLACFRAENLTGVQQLLLHTAYVNHGNNDVYKFQRIVQKYPSISYLSTLDHYSYLRGIDYLSRKKFHQNIFSPTLATALGRLDCDQFSSLITGSGPDEIFYGMEKYSWSIFEELQKLPRVSALEKLDPRYNEEVYSRLFNKEGHELYEAVLKNRKKLYINIDELGMDIFDSQRLLAYATVTTQHMQLFNQLATFFNLEHKAPYLNLDLVKMALLTPLTELVDLRGDKRVEMGKKYLKQYLLGFMDHDHVYGTKIGFHAPVNDYFLQNGIKCFENITDCMPSWLDKDKTLIEIQKRYQREAQGDYFLYSIYNILMHNTDTVYAN
jgi:asparagine synthetase B (glutamine-hydrolysing)